VRQLLHGGREQLAERLRRAIIEDDPQRALRFSDLLHAAKWAARWKHRRLSDRFAQLAKSLAAIKSDVGHALHVSIFHGEATDEGATERRDAINALTAIESFLFSQGVTSIVLQELRHDLLAVENAGETPARFKPPRRDGRKPDSPLMQGLKGRFAGRAYAQMESGLNRNQAASWVARNIPPRLARRMSSKPIRQSTIKEWMEQYGCSLRIRRELRSIKTETQLKDFIEKKTRSGEINNTFGVLHCLIMMFAERKRSTTEPPLEWAHQWSEIPEE